MAELLNLHAAFSSNGKPVLEEVVVEPLGGGRYRLLQSPGLVLDIAAGDVFELGPDGQFTVLSRGRNLCIQFYLEAPNDAFHEQAERVLGPIGRLDGKTECNAVFTVPVSVGFPAVEAALRDLIAAFPGVSWYYGNVYDPDDGVTPLNWWQDA